MELSLVAEARSDAGKGAARKLRAAGKLPAVIYAEGGAARSVAVDPTQLIDIFRHTRDPNTIVQLQVEGETVPVLVKDTQRHPVSRQLLHVDFYAVSSTRPVTVMVPVRGIGRPAGAALGGRLRLIRRELKTRCIYDKIPATHDVDVTPMEIGDMVKATQIPLAEGVELVFENDFNVLTVYGKRVRK